MDWRIICWYFEFNDRCDHFQLRIEWTEWFAVGLFFLRFLLHGYHVRLRQAGQAFEIHGYVKTRRVPLRTKKYLVSHRHTS